MPLLTPTATAHHPLRCWRTTALGAALAAMAGAVQADPALRCHTDPAQIATATGCSATLQGPEVYLHAPAQQVLLWQLDGGTHAHRVRLFGPDGQLLRQWPAVHNGRQEIGWVTPSAGRYHLQADNPFFDTAQAGAAPVQWRLQAHGTAQPTAPASTDRPGGGALASARLRQLQEQLALATPAQKAQLMENFWQQVQAQGSPWLEALEGQPEEALVTFLWRAPAGTATQPHQVRLEWAMRAADPFMLQALPGTDLWYLSLPLPRGLRTSYQLVVDPVRYPTAAGQSIGRVQRIQTEQLSAQRDALNPQRWHAGSPSLPTDSVAAAHAQRSALHISANGPLRNLAQADALPPLAGTLQHLRFDSRQLGNTRSLSLYLPPGPQPAHRLPLLVLFDREAYLERVQLPQLLEQAMRQGRIPPLAVLLVGQPTREDRARELPPHTPAFGQMLATELMPWLRARTPQLTTQPAQVVVAGSSYGGLAAGYLGWTHPETFGAVLSLSGSYWWAPPPAPGSPGHRWREGDWFMQQVAQSPKRPVRWHLGYGLLERGVHGEAGLVDNSRHLRNVLQAKGYAVSTDEFSGGHDYYAWGEALVQGLQLLLPAQSPGSAP